MNEIIDFRKINKTADSSDYLPDLNNLLKTWRDRGGLGSVSDHKPSDNSSVLQVSIAGNSDYYLADYVIAQGEGFVFVGDLSGVANSPVVLADKSNPMGMISDADTFYKVEIEGEIERDKDEARFKELCRSWKKETESYSTLIDIVTHSAYQEIIGLGKAALPFILEELRENGGHWFWALRYISGEDPAVDEDTVGGAESKWLIWGRLKSYIK